VIACEGAWYRPIMYDVLVLAVVLSTDSMCMCVGACVLVCVGVCLCVPVYVPVCVGVCVGAVLYARVWAIIGGCYMGGAMIPPVICPRAIRPLL
jgi:hypothetical protein